MTLEQFLERLRETPRGWIVSSNGLIRYIKGDEYACPISAVAGRFNGGIGMPRTLAGKLGLSAWLTDDIVGAADSIFCKADLRKQLLEACGLPCDSH
jgi:hypothetical protein